MQKISFEEIKQKVTSAMVEAGEGAFTYPSDYLTPEEVRATLPDVFAAMVEAYFENKHLEVS